MSFASKSLSALGRLVVIGVLLATFLVGMAGVVYMSLSGSELKVPEIVGKDYYEMEKELAALGLKLAKRADRPSTEKINTILEQLPKAGETVKTGQTIRVIVSKAGVEGEPPPPAIKDFDSDDTEKIEEMISDKPKKARANTNSNKKKPDTTRDKLEDESNSNSNSSDKTNTKTDDPEKKDTGTSPADKNRNASSAPPPKPQSSPTSGRPASGDQRPRQSDRP